MRPQRGYPSPPLKVEKLKKKIFSKFDIFLVGLHKVTSTLSRKTIFKLIIMVLLQFSYYVWGQILFQPWLLWPKMSEDTANLGQKYDLPINYTCLYDI